MGFTGPMVIKELAHNMENQVNFQLKNKNNQNERRKAFGCQQRYAISNIIASCSVFFFLFLSNVKLCINKHEYSFKIINIVILY